MLDSFSRTDAAHRRRPSAGAGEFLAALREGRPIEAAACVVVAHPDDETIGLGGRLACFHRLTLVHLTDGAPVDLGDARRAGFEDGASYARARARELATALAILGARPHCVRLGLTDQAAAFHLAPLARAMAALIADRAVVVTHSYEGGHPDHDAAAFAVQTACAALAQGGRRPPIHLEFAGYHLADGCCVAGAFWCDPSRPACEAAMSPDQLTRKRLALCAFRTQAEIIAGFPPEHEAYRQAPDYEFDLPAPPGEALYDQWGWAMTSSRWRELATAAMAETEVPAWA